MTTGNPNESRSRKTIYATWFNHEIRNYISQHCVCACAFVFFHYRFSVRSVIVKYNEFVSNEAMTDIIRTLLGWNKKYLYRLKNKKQSIEKYKSI